MAQNRPDMVKLLSMPKESSQHLPREDQLLRRVIARIERNDTMIIRRIFETLQIDGETKPSEEQIRAFIQQQRMKHARRHP